MLSAPSPGFSLPSAVFGHVFVGFLCLYLYCRIQNRIKQAGMTAYLSPQGLLLKLSKVYAVSLGEEKRIIEVPKQVRKIAEKLKLDDPLIREEFGHE